MFDCFQAQVLQHFNAVSTSQVMAISDLIVGRKYPIYIARHVRTKFGDTILLTLQTEENAFAKVYLPRRYCEAFTAEVLEAIMARTLHLQLCYEGLSEQSGMHKLSIA